MTIILTPLCYAYLAGSVILFEVWLVFFLARKNLGKEMLPICVLIGVLSVLTGYVWWTVDWWKPPTINHTIVGVEDLGMGFAAGGIMAAAYEVLFRIDSLQVPLGLVTPFQAFGADLVLSVPGCSRTDIPA
jgi:hypothetical protein